MKICVTLVALLACAECFIIPEEFPSLLSLVYSNIPPVKKGTDSRVGLGFRLGPHADFQILLELGPQKHTDSLGSSNPDNTAKRESLVMNKAQNLVGYVNSVKNYFSPQKKATGGKFTNPPGGKWIDWWRNNILTKKEIGKIEFNKIPGIDDRISRGSGKVAPQAAKKKEKSVVDHLRQLYNLKTIDPSKSSTP